MPHPTLIYKLTPTPTPTPKRNKPLHGFREGFVVNNIYVETQDFASLQCAIKLSII